ncbi:hypothetical protein [Mycobacterium sp.]|uniref:hypothetical protein n=1 Tax=Mycobacterium sp. TaxID=1785 RepID=UPI003F980935
MTGAYLAESALVVQFGLLDPAAELDRIDSGRPPACARDSPRPPKFHKARRIIAP